MTLLNEIIDRVNSMPDAKRKELIKTAIEHTKDMPWIPSPGPQTQAYYSKADVLLYGGEPGGGKAVSIYTDIPTPQGCQLMRDICVGDQVFDESGSICNVLAKSEIINDESYKVIFSDGSEIIADPRHQWVTSTRRERQRALKCTDEYRAKRRSNREKRGTGKRLDLVKRNIEQVKSMDLPLCGIRTTRQIYETLRVGTDNRVNHSIDVCAPLELPHAELLIDPYVLGAWLGDGTASGGSIAGIDEEVFQNVANSYEITVRSNKYLRGVIGLASDLRKAGVLNNKHIPMPYLRSSHAQRLSLLQGLMDTDGTCDERGHCEIQLTHERLINDVYDLINSLGIKVQMRSGDAKLYGRKTSDKWRLKFITDLPAFRMTRKLIRQKRSNFRGTHDKRYIVDCVPVDPVPMQCIQVDSPNSMYLCGRSMIPTHNSSLLLGLALTQHKRSLIMRRQYTDLGHLTDEVIKFNGGREGFNGSPPPKLKRKDGRSIEFFAAAKVGDEQHRQGNPFDLLGIDEATQVAESQIRFLMGWLRSADGPDQRKRVVLATNPPLTSDGFWVTEWFAPWLDDRFSSPAQPGELRYAITGDDDKMIWVDGPDPVDYQGRSVTPLSYTYIPASVSDNPYLADSGYDKQLDNLPNEIREILMGGFQVTLRDQQFQIIPSEWIRKAQQRWTPTPPFGIPMCAMGVDCTGGGKDPMVIQPRYDSWFDVPIEIPAKELPVTSLGKTAVGHIVAHRKDKALVIIDMGGGYGGSAYELLIDNDIDTYAYKGAEASTMRTKDGKLRFTNTRTAALWQFREALDPDQPGGSTIALPPDPEIMADLCAPTFKITPQGIQAESKLDVCNRLGRSTNKGDGVIMAWSQGAKEATCALEWIERKDKMRMRGTAPKVIMGRQHARRR